MHPLTPAVEAHLATLSRRHAHALRAWFSGFEPYVQDLLLERARTGAREAVAFGTATTRVGLVTA